MDRISWFPDLLLKEPNMKNQMISLILLILIVGILLASCSGERGRDILPDIQEETNDNLFTQPPVLETEESAEQKDATDTVTGKPEAYIGGLRYGFADTPLSNEYGRYNVYEGGELHIGYEISASGNLNQADFGILLFLDGLHQPYKTADDDTLLYLHVFHSDSGWIQEELILTPVTGKVGDTLELVSVQVMDLDFYLGAQRGGLRQTSTGGVHSTQLVFQADPPEAEWPAVHERVIEQNITNVDLTSLDMNGWTSEDLQEDSSFTMTTDHEMDRWIYAITPEDGLTVRAEVFGCPAVDWNFLVYVNHQPVSIQPENRIFFQTQNGRKTVIEVQLDLSDFDGEEILYAVLFARNWRDPAVFYGKSNDMQVTATYYLTDAADVDAVHEKYGIG